MIESTEIIAFISQLHRNDDGAVVLLDVRSPKEFALGHIPGAINLPLLNDEERHLVGITYKEHGQQEAVKKGFELVGHKFVEYIKRAEELSPRKELQLYCWRGGLRSNIMAWLLSTAGFKVKLLQGGYKSYRHLCYELFEKGGSLCILSGMTGTGKTEWLQKLSDRNIQVIDLEKLANHRGSAFGGLGQLEQCAQEHFENVLGWSLFSMREGIIWIEDESRFIGKLRIPDVFFQRMLSAPHVELILSTEKRIQRIIREYGSFPTELLAEKTKSITKRMGGDQVKQSLDALEQGDLEGWIKPLLYYYDKSYMHGKSRYEVHMLQSIDTERNSEDEVIQTLVSLSNQQQE